MVRSSAAYRIRIWAVPLFCAAYFSVAGVPALVHLGSGEEKYLFYHFFVFTEVPSREQVGYAVYVTVAGGKKITPTAIADAGVLRADDWHNRPEYQRRTNALGREVAAGNLAGVAREAFEDMLTVRSLTYEVREVRYDPIARYLTGEVHSEKNIATFTIE